MKNVYQRLEREGVLMPEEYSQEAVYSWTAYRITSTCPPFTRWCCWRCC